MDRGGPSVNGGGIVARTRALGKPVKELLLALWGMHTGSFMHLCLADLLDDQERLQRYCDQIALAAGLRLSFTYGSVQYAADGFVVIETNAPGIGYGFIIFATLTSCLDLVAVVGSVLASTVLTMVNTEEQLLYLAMACRRAIRVPLILFFASTYMFAGAFVVECWVRCKKLDQEEQGVLYEVDELAHWGWLASAIAWTLPMPFVFGPISSLLARLYQSRELISNFSVPPTASEEPAWFADPSMEQMGEYLVEYLEGWGPGKGGFCNPRPSHFGLFVLQKVRAKGHGSLSYLAHRRLEAVFEEKVEELLRMPRQPLVKPLEWSSRPKRFEI